MLLKSTISCYGGVARKLSCGDSDFQSFNPQRFEDRCMVLKYGLCDNGAF